MKEKSETSIQSADSKKRFTLIKNEEWKPARRPKKRIRVVASKDLPPAA